MMTTTDLALEASVSRRPARILIVDDDDSLRDLVSLTLRKAGHTCRTSRGGVEGLSALCSEDFAVVLTDLEMPDLGGKELLAAMNEAGIDATTIVLTGHGDVTNAVEAMKLGAFDFLLKPVVSDELICAVDRALEYNQVRQHGRAMERLAAEWQTTFDACSDLLGVFDTEQRLLRCNDALAARLAVDKNRAAGRSLADCLEAGSVAACTQTLADGISRTIEIHDVRLGGDLLVTTSPLLDDRGKLFGLVFLARNITERKQAARALERYAEQLEVFQAIDRATLSGAPSRQLLQMVLPHMRRLVPCEQISAILIDRENSLAEIVAGTSVHGTPPCLGQRVPLPQLLPLAAGAVYSLDHLSSNPRPAILDALQVAACGSLIALPLHHEGTPIAQIIFLSPQAGAFPATVQDTARKVVGHLEVAFHHARLFERVRASQESLQALSQRLVEAQEVERRHIARELHDEIGQQLTGLKLMVESGERTSEALTLVSDLMDRVRALSLELRPSMLDDLGLLPTLVWFLNRYSVQTGVRVSFDHQGLEGRFSSAIETAAYRIVQEALTNVARYAGVAQASVRIWASGETLTVQVQDRGAGFDVAAALQTSRSNGLTGMRERAMLLGGGLTVESAPRQGTQVTAEFPLDPRPAHERIHLPR
jgi:signal transduction histidine kinase/FixJ family two-component response regulator